MIERPVLQRALALLCAMSLAACSGGETEQQGAEDTKASTGVESSSHTTWVDDGWVGGPSNIDIPAVVDVALTIEFRGWTETHQDEFEVHYGQGEMTLDEGRTRGHVRNGDEGVLYVTRPDDGSSAHAEFQVAVDRNRAAKRAPFAWAEIQGGECLPVFARTDESSYVGVLPALEPALGWPQEPGQPLAIHMTATRGGILTGTVVEPEGEDPVEDAEVALYGENSRDDATLVARMHTNGEGRFWLPVAADGRHLITVEKSGVGMTASEIFEAEAEGDQGEAWLVLVGGAAGTMRLQNSLGEPLPDVQVRAALAHHALVSNKRAHEPESPKSLEQIQRGFAPGPFRGFATSNAQGRAEFPALIPGTYRMSARSGVFWFAHDVEFRADGRTQPEVIEAHAPCFRFQAREIGGGPIAWHPRGQSPLDPEVSTEALIQSALTSGDHLWSRGETSDTWYLWYRGFIDQQFEVRLAGRPTAMFELSDVHTSSITDFDLAFPAVDLPGKLIVDVEGPRPGESLDDLTLKLSGLVEADKRTFQPERLARSGQPAELELPPGDYTYNATLNGKGFEYTGHGRFTIRSGETLEHTVELQGQADLHITLGLPNDVSLPLLTSFGVVVREPGTTWAATSFSTGAFEFGVAPEPGVTLSGDVPMRLETLDEGRWEIQFYTSELESEWHEVTLTMGQATELYVALHPR
jgi:hypothetical protein